MHDEILDPTKRRVLELQSSVVHQQGFFLAGGTALGLRLGHRTSRDLDWFTARPFDAKMLAKELGALGEKPTKVNVQDGLTLRVYYGELETSFLHYGRVKPSTELKSVAGVQIPIADIETLAVMKAAAVHDRGIRRDFVDIHAICREPGWSVGRFIELATRKLPLQALQMKLALTYHADADKDVARFRYAVPWARVKADLVRGVGEWERSRSRGLDR